LTMPFGASSAHVDFPCQELQKLRAMCYRVGLEEEEEEQEQEQEEEVALMKVRPLPQCDASLERFEVQVSLD
jgi:hypothetical protein